MRRALVLAAIGLAPGCGFPRPMLIDNVDASTDSKVSVDAGGDGNVDGDITDATAICTPDQALRCTDGNLVRCNATGTAEVSEPCAVGCNAAALRCDDVDPSNGLAAYLDMTAGEPAIDLGASATINTDTGAVVADGAAVVVKSAILAQTAAPSIRVFIVRALVAGNVKIVGKNAVAVVSNADLKITGVFAASASVSSAGAGGFNDATCKGGNSTMVSRAFGGAGGGGFGLAGGRGGSAANGDGTATPGAGGNPTGNPTLIPLRGGCDGGTVSGTLFGGGGGAIQLVSRTLIAVTGVVAANGSSAAGGGSGGGILFEAPIVEVSGGVVVNGGSGNGGGCFLTSTGEDGRLDTTPAKGGVPCGENAASGDGGAGNSGAGNGAGITSTDGRTLSGGNGGGGVGRIRVNTAPGGLHTTGLFSPNPSTGSLATR